MRCSTTHLSVFAIIFQDSQAWSQITCPWLFRPAYKKKDVEPDTASFEATVFWAPERDFMFLLGPDSDSGLLKDPMVVVLLGSL